MQGMGLEDILKGPQNVLDFDWGGGGHQNKVTTGGPLRIDLSFLLSLSNHSIFHLPFLQNSSVLCKI